MTFRLLSSGIESSAFCAVCDNDDDDDHYYYSYITIRLEKSIKAIDWHSILIIVYRFFRKKTARSASCITRPIEL